MSERAAGGGLLHLRNLLRMGAATAGAASAGAAQGARVRRSSSLKVMNARSLPQVKMPNRDGFVSYASGKPAK